MGLVRRSVVFLLFAAATPPQAGFAQTIEQLDRLAEATAAEETGLALAQQQASRGEFLEALSSLERVLALHPKSQTARLLHAVYLCQIDDQQGGAVELELLKKKNFTEELWARAKTQCTLAKDD